MNNAFIIALTAGLVYLWLTSDESTAIDPQTGEPQTNMPHLSPPQNVAAQNPVQATPLPIGQQQPTLNNVYYNPVPVGGGQGYEYRMVPMVGGYAVGGVEPNGVVLLENPHITNMNNMPAGAISMFEEPLLY